MSMGIIRFCLHFYNRSKILFSICSKFDVIHLMTLQFLILFRCCHLFIRFQSSCRSHFIDRGIVYYLKLGDRSFWKWRINSRNRFAYLISISSYICWIQILQMNRRMQWLRYYWCLSSCSLVIWNGFFFGGEAVLTDWMIRGKISRRPDKRGLLFHL